MKKKGIIAIIAVLIIAGGGWYVYTKVSTKSPVQAGNTQSPAKVVARVNGTALSQKELNAVMQQIALTQGKKVSTLDTATKAKLQKAAITVLVGRTLLRQAVTASGIVAKSTDVDKQIAIVKAKFKTAAEFKAALVAQGLSLDQLRAQAAEGIAVRQYITKQLGTTKLTVTDAEVKAEYDKAIVGVNKPPTFAKEKAQIKAFLLQKKQQKLITGIVEKLRAKAKVVIL